MKVTKNPYRDKTTIGRQPTTAKNMAVPVAPIIKRVSKVKRGPHNSGFSSDISL